MSRMTFKQFCYLFCCPPCPSSVAAKIAFLPPDPSYQFHSEPEGKYSITLKESAHWLYTADDIKKFECFFVRTKRGNEIACVFVRYRGKPKFTLLFSHGNAVDLGHCSNYFVWLCAQLNCNIMSYDYSGYGISDGSTYEKNLYSDIKAVWRVLRFRYNVVPDKVILYGYSIGTVPTIHLAAKNKVAGVVIHSGLMSGLRMAFPDMTTTLCCDPFPSVDKVRKIQSPTLIIHGTDDEIIDFSHGLGLHNKCRTAVAPLWIDGGGHNDLENRTVFLERLKKFIDFDVLDN